MDINQGNRFVFLKSDANEKMRINKRRVTYIFEEKEGKEIESAKLIGVPHDSKLDKG